LRHNGKKYNKRKSRNSGRGLIPGRVDIDQRPAIPQVVYELDCIATIAIAPANEP
jgi:hypothetical protein